MTYLAVVCTGKNSVTLKLLRAQYRVELSKQDYISPGTRAEIHADESLISE